ncbi:hypothetical protein D3C84_1044890 [compost metagenome]
MRKLLSATLMKNCALAECGSMVRAMATVPTLLATPLLASFLMVARVAFCFMPGSKPPPWIMKLLITRWKTVPS